MIRPVGDAVVVKLEKSERMTPGGIVIPEKHAEKYDLKKQVATYIGAGPLAWIAEMQAEKDLDVKPVIPKPGDQVVLPAYAVYKVSSKDDEYQLVTPRDILAIIED